MRSMSCTTDEKAGLTETGPGFGDLDHLNVRSNVIGCGVHGVHQASLQCTSRSPESSRASRGKGVSQGEKSHFPYFFLWISSDLPFQTGHRYEQDKG
jgi:hypothetical protein